MDVLNISQPDQICENFCIPYAIWTGQWMDVLLGDFVTVSASVEVFDCVLLQKMA